MDVRTIICPCAGHNVDHPLADRDLLQSPRFHRVEPAMTATNGGPLAGIRVIDVATMLAGPTGCQLLADFGADVIKIEHPKIGDALRGHGASKDGIGLLWKTIARNKRCVGLYLGDPAGAEIFLELVKTADVIVESFRPGTLERWNLGYEQLRAVNPGIILVRVSGFGQTGPYASRAGFGTIVEAMSGFAAMTGEPDSPPVLPPFGLADGIAGLTVAFATATALYQRDISGGSGQSIDISLLEPLMSILGAQPAVYDTFHKVPERTGNRSSNVAPRNAYRAADGGWVAISTSAQSVAERVMRLVGHEEVIGEAWFKTGKGRAEHVDLLDEYVGSWIAERNRDEVLEAFTAVEAAIGPVFDIADLVENEHMREREVFIRVADEDFGDILMQNVIARFSESPGEIGYGGRALGADTDAILGGELKIGADRLEALRKAGVIS
jgi:crotonobetainyl-CoA:carnitine CoA-transferase CaiB-like acyl-CoA transferase